MEIIEYPYFVMTNGNIINQKTGKILKQQENSKGYKVVRVEIDGKKKTYRVHREVAKAYIPNPNNLPQVNHKDGNKSNNNVENLEWVTNQSNVNHAIKNGLWKNVFEASRKTNQKRMKPIIAKNLETGDIKKYKSISEAERDIGTRHICDVLKGKRSQAKGFFFYYA